VQVLGRDLHAVDLLPALSAHALGWPEDDGIGHSYPSLVSTLDLVVMHLQVDDDAFRGHAALKPLKAQSGPCAFLLSLGESLDVLDVEEVGAFDLDGWDKPARL